MDLDVAGAVIAGDRVGDRKAHGCVERDRALVDRRRYRADHRAAVFLREGEKALIELTGQAPAPVGGMHACHTEVTFRVTVLSPPILYNSSHGESRGSFRDERHRNERHGRSPPQWHWMVFAVLAAVALLAPTFGVHTQASFVVGSGPAGSAAYRQVIAFATCLLGHGVPDIPNPPPGGNAALSVPVPKSSPTARKQPHGTRR